MGKFNLLFQKARDSLSAAQLLLDEGYIDIAASRVYYAMFYIAEALLFSKGLAFSSHSAVIAAYGKEFARTGLLNPEHHQHLRDAFQARQVGDYLVEREISSATVVELIEWGKCLAGSCKGCGEIDPSPSISTRDLSMGLSWNF